MKKFFATTVAATLVLGALSATPALAKKKKKKPPTPVTRTITFEESGSMSIPGPQGQFVLGITEGEFVLANGCASMPMSQGVDGHVVELPADFRLGTASVEILGIDATGAYDMNAYFYDGACGLMNDYSLTEGSDPIGGIPAGASWVVIDLILGANATFDLKATATITE